MGRRKNTTPEQVSSARLRWLRAQSRRLMEDQKGAKEAGSWSAAASFAREIRTLRDMIDSEAMRQAELEELKRTATPQTAEARAALLSQLVDAASDDELEVCLAEWCKRRRYRLVVDEGGTLQIVPLGESGPDLQVLDGGR